MSVRGNIFKETFCCYGIGELGLLEIRRNLRIFCSTVQGKSYIKSMLLIFKTVFLEKILNLGKSSSATSRLADYHRSHRSVRSPKSSSGREKGCCRTLG